GRPRRTGARPWRRRRASSTRCAHADEQRNQPPRGITLRREHDHQRAPRVACWRTLRAWQISTAHHRQFWMSIMKFRPVTLDLLVEELADLVAARQAGGWTRV